MQRYEVSVLGAARRAWIVQPLVAHRGCRDRLLISRPAQELFGEKVKKLLVTEARAQQFYLTTRGVVVMHDNVLPYQPGHPFSIPADRSFGKRFTDMRQNLASFFARSPPHCHHVTLHFGVHPTLNRHRIAFTHRLSR